MHIWRCAIFHDLDVWESTFVGWSSFVVYLPGFKIWMDVCFSSTSCLFNYICKFIFPLRTWALLQLFESPHDLCVHVVVKVVKNWEEMQALVDHHDWGRIWESKYILANKWESSIHTYLKWGSTCLSCSTLEWKYHIGCTWVNLECSCMLCYEIHWEWLFSCLWCCYLLVEFGKLIIRIWFLKLDLWFLMGYAYACTSVILAKWLYHWILTWGGETFKSRVPTPTFVWFFFKIT